ncbi:MAG: hypothetical protein HGB06_07960 [Chlorobaculum sp.]|jgi:hypothetical protein|nr:hypothetical protein [Chlorobaculum sp.]
MLQNYNKEIYLKVIDYKRSIGVTQWAVFSIFSGISSAVLALSYQKSINESTLTIRILGLICYWLGYFLYNRYRNLNKNVASYLRELEKDIKNGFQTYLDKNFHKHGIHTGNMLFMVGILYMALVVFDYIANN